MTEDETTPSKTMYRLGGVTGLGWTVSILAYLSTILGYGNVVIARLVGSPRALLYLGGGLLVATLGLDRLQSMGADDDDVDDAPDETPLRELLDDDQPE